MTVLQLQVKTLFDLMDADEDGMLTIDELLASHLGPHQFASADAYDADVAEQGGGPFFGGAPGTRGHGVTAAMPRDPGAQ